MFYRTQYTSHALDHFTEAEILQKVSDLGIVLPLTLPDALASNETITIYSNSVVDQIFHIQSTTTFTNETFNPPGEYFGHYTYSLNWYNAAAFSESTLAVDYPAFTNSTTYTLDWNSTTGGVLSATGDENISTNAGWTFLYTGH